ncbi:hypothetical protein BDZ97DRAFT_1767277, partial [Flammula alnicola]
HPTIAALADFLVNLVTDPHATHTATSRIDLIEEMIRKYSFVQRDIDTVKDSGIRRNGPTADGAVVLLTGSTGNLGSQVLEALLRDSRIAKLGIAGERHLERFRDKGLDESLLKSSSHHVDIIIHTAWRLDFNLSLSSFESSIRGTRNLIELAHSSPHVSDIKFIFTSSVASALSWDQSQGPYPEEVVLIQDMLLVTDMGKVNMSQNVFSRRVPSMQFLYGLARLVEVVLKAPGYYRLDAYIGEVKSCLALNVLHSQPIEWNAMIQYVADALVRERNLAAPVPLVPFQDWFSSSRSTQVP